MLISFQHTLTGTLAVLLITRYLNLGRGNRGWGDGGVCAGGGDGRGRNEKEKGKQWERGVRKEGQKERR